MARILAEAVQTPVERRIRARRTQPDRRQTMRWEPDQGGRRQGYGRRAEDRPTFDQDGA